MSDDWFDDDCDISELLLLTGAPIASDASDASASATSAQRATAVPSKVRVHKRASVVDISRVADTLAKVLGYTPTAFHMLQYIVLHLCGMRNVRKDPLPESQLTASQREIYTGIRRALQDPVRKARILDFINKPEITKRLVNYFVIQYALVEQEISYYLDRRTYPHVPIGAYNEPNQPAILQLIASGANIQWTNFHQEYKLCKTKNGNRNRHAPYRRSITVLDPSDGETYSLCELNFYIWLDDVGGFNIFYHFEQDIRAKKTLFDEKKRAAAKSNRVRTGPKPKKQKTTVTGLQYQAFALQYAKAAPMMI